MKTKNLLSSNIFLGVLFTAIVVATYSFTFSTAFAATLPTVNVSINNESNVNVTSVPVGTIVHLNTSVSSSTGPVATGTVDFSSYQNTTCSGNVVTQNGVVLVNGTANSVKTIVGSNGLSYKVFYNSQSGVYASTTSSCVSVIGTSVNPTPTPTPTGTGSLSGTAYNDSNKNKVKDSGEAGISGFTVKLYGGTFWWNWNLNRTKTVATTTTDANGNYSFTGLTDGIYRIEETKLNGWNQISGDYRWVLMINGKSLTGLDFANHVKVSATSTATTTPPKKDHKNDDRDDDKKERKEEKREEHKQKKINKWLEKIEKIKNR